MSLERYRSKRQFAKTPEPQPAQTAAEGQNRFYIQRHSARRLHYDLRLELDGVLKSWALPNGPTLDPTIKRLAVHVEDHPIEYGTFEGTIPQGNYGAGTVTVWDHGHYEPLGEVDVRAQLERGDFKFRIHGQKLAGEFALVRTNRKGGKDWLLIKKKDFAVIEGWDPESDTRSVRPPSSDLSTIAGAVKADFPAKVSPMLAILSTTLPEGPDWVYEPKWDGVRSLCTLKDGKVSLLSRTARAMDSQYPELAELPRFTTASTAIFDGEIVALDDKGRPNFPLLQSRIGTKPAESLKQSRLRPVTLFVFDLLYLNGYDLRGAALLDRKALLKSALLPSSLVRFSEHFTGNGQQLLHAARQNQLEGVLAKRGSSQYQPKRTRDWVKVKFSDEQDFVICGFTKGERDHFGALVLGYWDGKRFVHAGNVGTGFNEDSLAQIHTMLRPLVSTKSPFADVPKIKEQVTWVRAEAVCRVKYMAWPKDGNLRAPVFVGIRNDIDPKDCTRENVDQASLPAQSDVDQTLPRVESARAQSTPLITDKKAEQILTIDDHPLKFSNLNKVFYPREGYTKRDILNYYHAVAPLLVPHLKDRPLSLKRYPDGIDADYFFQKNAPAGVPSWIRSELIDSEHRQEAIRFLFAENEASLLYLANLGCIDQNPWMSRFESLENPDFLLIDLDPVQCAFDRIVEAANLVKPILDSLGLQGFPKTTGGDGLHIYVPLEPTYSYAQVRSFAEIIARLAIAQRPDLFTTPRSVEKREKGKVYFDYLQISSGKTISAPYVLRAFPGAPVSTPLRWNELTRDLTPDRFTIANAPDRFARLGDLFAPVLHTPQRLEPALEKLGSQIKK
jgi:bifunctional non-homologous end joining protein LigD